MSAEGLLAKSEMTISHCVLTLVEGPRELSVVFYKETNSIHNNSALMSESLPKASSPNIKTLGLEFNIFGGI